MQSTPFKGYALIDCNNFFVSCERVFKPHLNKVPVAVLSNNDGCFIARSKEVKDLGIPMGAPLFKYKHLVDRHNIVTFSSNFKLYGDFSDRVMSIIGDFSPDLEVYSIDEAFIPITIQTEADFIALRKKIYKWTSIPVSIGIAPTKTLAKLANYICKKEETGFYSLMNPKELDAVLKRVPIQEVWGIGRGFSKKLSIHNIHTAYGFKNASEDWIKRKMGLSGLRTHLELKGVTCSLPEVTDSKRKSLIYSKSFGSPITSLIHLKEAVSHYSSKAAEKIRRTGYRARLLSLYLKLNEESLYESVHLSHESNSTLVYIDAALHLLKKLYKNGRYLKAGIYLNDLVPSKETQLSLFEKEDPKHLKLMNTLDEVNYKYGQNTLFFASEGLSKPWAYRRNHMSCEYTTKWKEFPIFKI